MNRIREVIAYGDHFENFVKNQPVKVQNKIFKIIEAIETLERVPENYLKIISGTRGLYEARISLASNIWRVFSTKADLLYCLMDSQKKLKRLQNVKLKKHFG